jgi:hypothetical protein
MSEVVIRGIGAVSPAGWGVPALRAALSARQALPHKELARPGWNNALRVRRVPPPPAKPSYAAHARLRRTSPITAFAIAAALEALAPDFRFNDSTVQPFNDSSSPSRLGIILCVMTGCVNYSSRFYAEALHDPSTASPLIFPETVFNAPGSHLAALLGSTGINYTLVGDPGTFLQALALAGHWLRNHEVDGCLVVGAEESDWLTTDAYRLFDRDTVLAEGAGAIYLRRADNNESSPRLISITSSHTYCGGLTRERAATLMAEELFAAGHAELLCDGAENPKSLETRFWKGWSGARLSPKRILGEGLAAASAWQCAAAVDSLIQRENETACVSVVGCNQQAIGARFAFA